MPPKKPVTSRAKRVVQSEDSELSMDSDYISSNVNDLSKPSKQSSHKKDAAGEQKVKCRFCLKVKSQKKSLKRHVERNHKACYERYRDKGRSNFVADYGQMIPEDPDYVEQPPAIQKIEAPPVQKRPNLGEANEEVHVNEFG